MDAIKNNGSKLMFVAVLLLCVAALYLTQEENPPELAQLLHNEGIVQSSLDGHIVSDNYPYSAKAAAKMNYQERFADNFSRASKDMTTPLPAYISYPRPARPKTVGFDDKVPRTETDDYARLNEITDLKISSDHGAIYLSFQAPKENKYMDLVRVEIYRGETEKIDLGDPFDAVILGPEEPPAEAAGGRHPKDDAKPSEESSGAQRRKFNADAPTPAPAPVPATAPARTALGAKGAAKDVKKEPPPLVFADTHVEPKKKYFYQVRIVGRMTVEDGRSFDKKDAGGAIINRLTIHAPPNLPKIPPSDPESKTGLYATAFSPVVSTTTPPSYEFRFSATQGVISTPDTPEPKQNREYKGTFAVRAWLIDIQDWKTVMVNVGIGQRLAGEIRYNLPNSREPKFYTFDTGYELVEIKAVHKEVIKTILEPALDANGNAIVGPHGPVMVKRDVNESHPDEIIATLKDTVTGKLEEYTQQGDFKLREEGMRNLQRIWKEQEKLDKEELARIKKSLIRLKAEEQKREAERKSAVQAPPQPVFNIPQEQSTRKY